MSKPMLEEMPLDELLAKYQGRKREHHTGYTGEMARRLRKLGEVVAQCEAENSIPKPTWLRRILDRGEP